MSYESDPEDARTKAEKARDEAYQKKARGGDTRVMEPAPEVVAQTDEEKKVAAELEWFKAKRAAWDKLREGIEVEM